MGQELYHLTNRLGILIITVERVIANLRTYHRSCLKWFNTARSSISLTRDRVPYHRVLSYGIGSLCELYCLHENRELEFGDFVSTNRQLRRLWRATSCTHSLPHLPGRVVNGTFVAYRCAEYSHSSIPSAGV